MATIATVTKPNPPSGFCDNNSSLRLGRERKTPTLLGDRQRERPLRGRFRPGSPSCPRVHCELMVMTQRDATEERVVPRLEAGSLKTNSSPEAARRTRRLARGSKAEERQVHVHKEDW